MIGFGEFAPERRGTDITSLNDNRLVKIDTQIGNFYDKVLTFDTPNEKLQDFINAVIVVKEAETGSFYKPIFDPSIVGEQVVYEKKRKPAVGYSISDWIEFAGNMPKVQELTWKVGTEFQYYAFLVWLINNLVSTGWSLQAAMEMVVLDSKKLGHYENSVGALKCLELTGARKRGNAYDLANTCKYLRRTGKKNTGFWIAGGHYGVRSDIFPLAELTFVTSFTQCYCDATGWLILE